LLTALSGSAQNPMDTRSQYKSRWTFQFICPPPVRVAGA
jgi:hypothetical protein